MKVLILGGGLAGSTVAYLLGKKGYGDLSIVEMDTIGGLCQTHELGGDSP